MASQQCLLRSHTARTASQCALGAGLRPAVPLRRAVQVQAMSEATGPVLKKPELKRPERKVEEPAQKKLFAESQSVAAVPTATVTAEAPTASTTPVITVEYQRQRAREMRKYFEEIKFEEKVVKSKVFGWTPENEINNGRWVMMGLAIGLLTEYATGVDFIHQLQLMFSYLGLSDTD